MISCFFRKLSKYFTKTCSIDSLSTGSCCMLALRQTKIPVSKLQWISFFYPSISLAKSITVKCWFASRTLLHDPIFSMHLATTMTEISPTNIYVYRNSGRYLNALWIFHRKWSCWALSWSKKYWLIKPLSLGKQYGRTSASSIAFGSVENLLASGMRWTKEYTFVVLVQPKPPRETKAFHNIAGKLPFWR